MGVFAEFERAMIAERVRPGLRRANQAALNDRERTGDGVRGIAKRFGVDPSTVQRIARPFADAAA